MAKLYLKQKGTQVEAWIEVEGKVVLNEKFKKSEAIAKLDGYFKAYDIDFVEHNWKVQGIGGAGCWSTLVADSPKLVEHFKETYSWTFRDKRKAV